MSRESRGAEAPLLHHIRHVRSPGQTRPTCCAWCTGSPPREDPARRGSPAAGFLVIPIDLIPDIIPVLGYAAGAIDSDGSPVAAQIALPQASW
jgi:hypothetical protein